MPDVNGDQVSAHPPIERIFERFEGFVDRVEGDTAFITLTNRQGDRLSEAYPAQELAEGGVHEHDRFVLTTVDEGKSVGLKVSRVPDQPVSEEELREIDTQLHEAFHEDGLDVEF